MKYLSLCDGIGAAHEASKELKWTCVGASEIAPFPIAVVKERHPEVKHLGDMTKHENWNIEQPDLICGGTPCQSFSVAGLRGGLADPRGNLALVFLGIVDRHRPRWVVWENVPGVYSATSHEAPDPDQPGLPLDVVRDQDVVESDSYDADEDHAFACFLAGLQELGYGVQYRTFDAQYFGVAQRRNRVFVVGYLGDWRPATAVLLEPQNMSGNPPPSRRKGEGPAGTLAGGARERGGHSLDDIPLVGNPLLARHNVTHGDVDTLVPEVANPLTARMHKGVNTTMDEGQTMVPVAWKMRGGGNGTGERGGAVGTQGGVGYLGQDECAFTLSTTEDQMVAVPYNIHAANSNAMVGPGDADAAIPTEVSRSLDTAGFAPNQGGTVVAVPFAFKPAHFTRDKDGAPADIAPPLSCEADKGDQEAVVCQQMAVRRLTPRECERLQGFPDDYTMIHWRGKHAEWCPDGPRYKALGNSWAVPNVRWIFRRIQKVDDILKRLAA